MLICPECGNICFPGIDVKNRFQCPAAGCHAFIDPADPPVVIRGENAIPVSAGDFWNNSEKNPYKLRRKTNASENT